MEGVTTVTIPTPIHPILTCQHPSQVIRITPEHPMPLPNPLAPSRAPSCLSNALLNTPTPLRLVDAFPTRRSFDLSPSSRQVDSQPDAPLTFPLPRVKSIPDTHTHPRPDAPSTFPFPRVKLIPNTHTHSQPNALSTFPLPHVKSTPDIHTHSRPDAI